MNAKQRFKESLAHTIQDIYNITPSSFELKNAKEPYDVSYVLFQLAKQLNKTPKEIADTLGPIMLEGSIIQAYEFNKGFMNVTLSSEAIVMDITMNSTNKTYGFKSPGSTFKTHMIEFSSPNTNKPLHLGHVRNCLLGMSLSRIQEAMGNRVIKTQIVNDRGIHICKSMAAYLTLHNPIYESLKGDAMVGTYYVMFEKQYQEEVASLIDNGLNKDYAHDQAPIMQLAKRLLYLWEINDPKTLDLWEKLNTRVYEGFDVTYKKLQVEFDETLYESNTYLFGKDIILKGLEEGIFYQKEDKSIWAKTQDAQISDKLLLRGDGTSVYITQDIGTAVERFKRHADLSKLTHVVGDEQIQHFKTLFEILEQLKYPFTDKLEHVAYGMVTLPHGRMKSRQGTVVDADGLMKETKEKVKERNKHNNKIGYLTTEEKNRLFEIISMSAIKFQLLSVDAKKTLQFNPEEAIMITGKTGPFIQYTHTRIKSLLDKADISYIRGVKKTFTQSQKDIIFHLYKFEEIIEKSSLENNPAFIANYTYQLAKMYNSFYQSTPILSDNNPNERQVNIHISMWVKNVLKNGLYLLGIETPEVM